MPAGSAAQVVGGLAAQIVNGLAAQVVAGLADGSIYAILALALVMTYRSTHHLNFAQGEMATFSTYLALTLIEAGVPYWAALAATVVASFAIGLAIERVLIRPLAAAPALTIVGVLVGLMLIVNSLNGWLFGYTIKPFPTPFPTPFADRFGGLVSARQLGTLAVTLCVLAAVSAFFRFTRTGIAMRAAAQNPVAAGLVGIPVQRMLALGWGLAAAIGAVAGCLAAPVVFLDPDMMAGILLYAFAGAVLGGLDSPLGAVVGGFAVGVIENLAGAYLVGTELKLTLALVVIVAVLTVRPTGLLGHRTQSRV